ncbi:pyridoxal 5'-phosphate synthase glutaminase subunit PdxT [Arcanobacterium pinnipediorum]|uniref:glutaminase n=1 Tax=Arcanobacterium pinnipediorum TaxID=1503041 RepID=A0ABY5AFV9_9ACTO|nr:pyridoxal 5'-phosphate synthase glutaminase subunit PdxT [Arcanobacterium pinnipediorum]USR78895.1 pyridoxal 5'-phosphate synthase glutaminase subunit PdxT [Arcanobacterium pinnipediorum]
MVKTVGVLAVQGAFIEHRRRLEQLGFEAVELRNGDDARRDFDGLVLPGGESTVQSKLLRELDMFEPLAHKLADGLPVFGTCAGLILLAQQVANGPVAGVEHAAPTSSHVAVAGFSTMPVTVVRNAYGRQLGSFHIADGKFYGGEAGATGKETQIPMTFIRAPHIAELGEGVKVLAALPDGTAVAVTYRNQLGATFHPELDEDMSIYTTFAQML